MSFDLVATRKKAETVIGILNAAGYNSHLVGGALRVQGIGGTTSDVDIAVICEDYVDLINALTDIQRNLLPPLGLFFEIKHQSFDYKDTEFLADLRGDGINIICYAGWKVPTVEKLVDCFDLNINQFYLEDGVLKNKYFDGKTVRINPKRDNPEQTNRLAERIARFKAAYPDLDWSNVP